MSDDKEVNGYGLTDEEYREARRFAKSTIKGEDPDPIKVEVTPEKEEPVVTEAASEEPAKEVEAVQDDKQPEATPAEETKEETDPLAGLPEDTRARVEALLNAEREKAKDLQHRESSSRGRLSAFQRKAEEAARELAELKAQVSQSSKPAPKPLKESATTPRLKELAENDPAYLEALDEFRAELRKEIEAELKPVTERFEGYTKAKEQERQEEYVRHFTETLDAKYDNWREIVYDVDESGRVKTNEEKLPIFSKQWAHCISEQPPALQKAMLEIGTPEDAEWALEHYRQWGVSKGYIKEEGAPAPNPQADKIAAKREQDLKKASAPKSASLPLATNTPFDPSDEKQLERMRKLAREAIRKGDPTIYSNAR